MTNTRSNYTLSGILMLTLFICVLLYISTSRPQNQASHNGTTSGSRTNEISHNNDHRMVDDATKPLGKTPSSLQHRLESESEEVILSRKFMNANNALSAESFILDAETRGIDAALDWRYVLDSACMEQELSYANEQINNGDSIELNTSRFAEMLEIFCSGYTPSINFDDLDFIEHSILVSESRTNKAFIRLTDKWKNIPESDSTDAVKQFVLSSKTPEDLTGLANYLNHYFQQSGQSFWNPDVNGVHINPDRKPDAQSTALELISCQKFGGCDSDSLKVIRSCIVIRECRSAWTYLDIVNFLTSPAEIEYIKNIIIQLRNDSI